MVNPPVQGFPLSDDYAATRVPNAVLGRVLSSVDDSKTIKLILRAVWLLERQRGYPRFITLDHLHQDRVLTTVFSDTEAIDRATDSAIGYGVLVRVSIDGVQRLMLNTASANRSAFNASGAISIDDVAESEDGWDTPADVSGPVDAFRAYEENMGVLSPMIRESILSALEDFTDDDITRAIRIAVENESRSWSFVAGVLRRWSREGVPYERREGTTGEAADQRIPEAQLSRYLEEQRKRDRVRST